MASNLLDQLAKNESTLRPTMHLVKIYSPLIAAISKREKKDQFCKPIDDLITQIDSLINSVLASSKLPVPGQEWQRATIRSAILPLCVDDIEGYGDIRADSWIKSVCNLTKSLNIHPSEISNQLSQAGQVKLALSDSATKLLNATSNFSFLRSQTDLVENLIHIIFKDAQSLCDTLGTKFLPDKGILMSNFLKNHTHLMIGAIESEIARITPTLNEHVIIENQNGLPLDGLLALYKENANTLATMVPEFSNAELTSEEVNHKTPSFLNI